MSTTTETERPVLSALDGIRERERSATPGPWRWRGNTDNGDPYLAGGYHRDAGGKPVGHAQDVLGHIPHEITRDEARRVGVGNWDDLPEPDIDRLPLDTYDERYEAAMTKAAEAAIDEYLTDPYGGPVKESRMAFCTDYMYTQARDLVIYEVAPDAASRADKRVYRADISGIRHPDAEFIAHAREDIRVLLAGYDVLLGEHATRALFLSAGDCDCGPMDGPMLERVHPMGDGDAGRICVLTQIDTYCKACTELEYGQAATADEYTAAAACIVRPLIEEAIAAALKRGAAS